MVYKVKFSLFHLVKCGSHIGKRFIIKADSQGNTTSTLNFLKNPNKKLYNTYDFLGKELKPKKNIPFIELFDDGTVEKRITID